MANSVEATLLEKVVHSIKSLIASIYWLATMGRWGVQGVFDTLYAGQVRSATFRKIYQDVFAADYAEEADPTGYLTMTDLRNIVEQLHVAQGQTFVDLACGRGGASLWVARATGAALVGIDISPVAVDTWRGGGSPTSASRAVPSFTLATSRLLDELMRVSTAR